MQNIVQINNKHAYIVTNLPFRFVWNIILVGALGVESPHGGAIWMKLQAGASRSKSVYKCGTGLRKKTSPRHLEPHQVRGCKTSTVHVCRWDVPAVCDSRGGGAHFSKPVRFITISNERSLCEIQTLHLASLEQFKTLNTINQSMNQSEPGSKWYQKVSISQPINL